MSFIINTAPCWLKGGHIIKVNNITLGAIMYDYWRLTMTSDHPIRIGTHDGSFHADEVLAIAILSTIHPNHHVVRTRDPDTLSWMDIVVDVGGIYDHGHKRYDHHMAHPPRGRDNHIYSSAGLVWRHYAQVYLDKIGLPRRYEFGGTTIDLFSAVERHIRSQWIEPIDRSDNGVSHELTPISVVVQAMRPTDPVKSRATYDAAFLETVSMVSLLFERSCFHAADHTIAQTKHMVTEKRLLNDGKIVVSDHIIPSYRHYSSTDAHFAIHPSLRAEGLEHNYIIRPIPREGQRSAKTPVPLSLLGARREMIEDLTRIEGVSYVHHNGFLVLADSEEAAIKFACFCLQFS
jgi:uncharacterized UPF0160 family protein